MTTLLDEFNPGRLEAAYETITYHMICQAGRDRSYRPKSAETVNAAEKTVGQADKALAAKRGRPGRVTAAEALLRRERVICAADRLFVLHGLGGTSLDAVARDASVTKRTIYLLFASKEGLFVEVVKRRVDAVGAAVQSASISYADLPAMLTSIALAWAHALADPCILAIYRIAIGEIGHMKGQTSRAINLYGGDSAQLVLRSLMQTAETRGIVCVIDIAEFVEAFIELVLSPRFGRWLVGDAEVNSDAAAASLSVTRFLRAVDDLYRTPL